MKSLFILEGFSWHLGYVNRKSWFIHSSRLFSCKSYFDMIIDYPNVSSFPLLMISNAHVPLRVKIFAWSLANWKLITNDTFQKRRPICYLLPQRCIIMCKSSKCIDNLFLHYTAALALWVSSFSIGRG